MQTKIMDIFIWFVLLNLIKAVRQKINLCWTVS